MGVLYLSVELALDLIACLLGVVLMIQARDNNPKFWWGGIALAIGGVFAWENIEWLMIVSETPEYRFTELLNLEKMLKWYPMASMVALFPLASLFPGFLSVRRTFLSLLPSFLLTFLGGLYLYMGAPQTLLGSLSDVLLYFDRPDVWLRCLFFLLSVSTPLACFLYPMLRRKGYRRVNDMMYVFLGFMCLFIFIYVLFTLDISYIVFNLFGATAIVFTLFFSIQYLFRENPFSCHVEEDKGQDRSIEVEAGCPQPLYYKMRDFFLENPQTVASYDMKRLAGILHERESALSDAVKSAGYSSFREYQNELRLEYFRRMALEHPEKNIKELIFLVGFRSKATFYRIFSEKYGRSPSAFLEEEKKRRT